MLRKLRRLVIKTRTLIEKRKVALCRMRGVVHEAGEVASHGHGGARVYLAVWVLTLFESHACKVETVRVSERLFWSGRGTRHAAQESTCARMIVVKKLD